MEIRGTNPNINPIGPDQGPTGPSGPGSADKAKGAGFNETMAASGPASTGAAGQAASAGATDPVLAKLEAKIQEGVRAGSSKQQILESVISEQLKAEFGSKATPQMTAAVAERFQTDPNLSQIFNRLYAMATK